MTELRFPGQAPSQVARHFLGLLDDVYHMHGLFLDEITTLRARIAELEASRSPFVTEHVPIPDVPGCAVYFVSPEGRIQSWSGGACEIYGYSAAEIIGQRPDRLRAGESPAGEPAAAPFLQTSRRVTKDGRAFEVYLHHAVLLDEAGHVRGRMHVEIPLESPGPASLAGGAA
jgi:PAS domain S-box-containing protein